MSLKQLVEAALAKKYVDEDGEPVEMVAQPALSPEKIDAFAASLPCPLPDDVRELLGFCAGLEGWPLEAVDFAAPPDGFGYEDFLPHGLPIALDGWGNYWAIDLHAGSTAFGPVYFVCHDAPVLLYQAADLEEFLVQLFEFGENKRPALIDDVHEDRLFDVWRTNPGRMAPSEAAAKGDNALRDFAAGFDDETHDVFDLRGAKPGFGMPWGRYEWGSVKRAGELPIFALKKKVGLFARLKKMFGGK